MELREWVVTLPSVAHFVYQEQVEIFVLMNRVVPMQLKIKRRLRDHCRWNGNADDVTA